MADEVKEAEEKAQATNAPASLTFDAFLETIGPSQQMHVKGIAIQKATHYGLRTYLNLPDIRLHCTHKNCEGTRIFRPEESISIDEGKWEYHYVRYLCSNCTNEKKVYALASRIGKGTTDGQLYKFGELPAFGPPTPPRLLKLLDDHRDYFLKGRRAEIAGLGIGAFAYYRRVVESAKDAIFDAIIKVANIEGAAPEMIADLEAAKKQTQFTAAVESVKHGIPKTLFIHGENPLTLLHTALSDGVHARTDEECVQDASVIRLVLVNFAEKLVDVLKEDAELAAAVKQLRQRRPRS